MLEGDPRRDESSATFTVTLSAAERQGRLGRLRDGEQHRDCAGRTTWRRAATLNLLAGETTKTITVTVNGDELNELNETYFVNLTAPTNATLADGQGLGTITDDDGTPELSIIDHIVVGGLRTGSPPSRST